MANPYSIKIVLPTEAEESAMAGAGSASTGGNRGGDNFAEVVDPGNGAEMIAKKAKQMISFAAVKSTADQIINYRISTVSLRTGATEYEQRINTVYSIASQSVGALGSLIMGGLGAGPAGIAVAAMGIVANGMQKILGIAQKENTLRLQESVENVSIGMQNVRAGTVGRRGNNQ